MRLKDPLALAADPKVADAKRLPQPQPQPQAPPQAAPDPKPQAQAPAADNGAKPAQSGDGAAEARIAEAIRAIAAGVLPTAGAIDRAQVEAIVDARLDARPCTVVEVRHLPADAKPKVEKVDGQHPLFPTLLSELALGLNVYLGGPAGSGKTTACRKAAEVLGRPFFIVTAVMDTFQVSGFMNAGGEFVETETSRWAETAGAVLLLDEVDGFNPSAALAYNSILADRIMVTAKGKVHIDPSNLVIATANTWGLGATNDYVGRNKLDAAFLDRFATRLAWDYDEAFERRIACAAAGISDPEPVIQIQKLRANARAKGIKVIITPRASIAHAKRVASGVKPAESLERGVLAGLDAKQREALLAGIPL